MADTTPLMRNRILAALSREDLDSLRPHLEPVDLPVSRILYEVDQTIDHIYFLDGGMASVVVPLADGSLVEVGVVGREGLVGVPALLGTGSTTSSSLVQMPGRGVRIGTSQLREAMQRSPALLGRVLRYAQALQVQISQTAACNARHNLPERLARWLLMAHNRADGDVLPLTQELISTMLGVRRAGVTVTVHTLRQAGVIDCERGRITVRDRALLEACACECYGTVKEQFNQLLG